MNQVNFKNINVMLCCFGNERVVDLYAAAFNILMNVENANMVVAFNTTNMDTQSIMRKGLLEALANVTSNTFEWMCFDESLSKAAMIASVIREHKWETSTCAQERPWYLNVDDDYMIPYKTLKLFELASNKPLSECSTYVYGQFDIINYRDYEDWDDAKVGLEDILPFVQANGMRCIPNHLAPSVPDELVTFKMPGQSTGAYMMDLNRIDFDVLEVLQNWPKGKRGYDEFLCREVGNVRWIYGSNSYHTDRTMAHVDGKVWQTDVFRSDLMMDGSVKGRQPSKLGEMSIARNTKPEDAPEIPNSPKEKQ